MAKNNDNAKTVLVVCLLVAMVGIISVGAFAYRTASWPFEMWITLIVPLIITYKVAVGEES